VSWNGSIPGSGSVTITIDAVIGSTFNAPISNQGSLAYDADGNGVKEAAGVTDDPNVPGAGNPTTIGVAGAIDIPTLSMVGLLSLLGLLAAAALVLMRGRVFDPAARR
jgi:hypothetical protein